MEVEKKRFELWGGEDEDSQNKGEDNKLSFKSSLFKKPSTDKPEKEAIVINMKP